jgi:hypothetical protein
VIQPWRHIAIPHQDVLKGTFQQSEFAGDISQVQQGKAPPVHRDARQFFTRTFVTEGMHLLLDNVIRRLAGQAGDPVIQLQTASANVAKWPCRRSDQRNRSRRGGRI